LMGQPHHPTFANLQFCAASLRTSVRLPAENHC
jgi:hypothetical protein